jgi:SAM-dependent methyltransferase
MHDEAFAFVHKVAVTLPGYFLRKKVLEVGSLDINGSVRPLFTQCDYWGIDLGEGNGVDQVINILDFPGKFYDVVISSEMLEHDREWKFSLIKMFNCLVHGGLLIFTCAGPDRPPHGTMRENPEASPFTNDYYGNLSIKDVTQALNLPEAFFHYTLQYDRGKNDLQFFGIKR